MVEMADEESTNEGTPGPNEVTPDDVLEKIRHSSWYLHRIIGICSLAWAINAIGIMSSAFYDNKEPNSTKIILSEEFNLTGDRSYLRELPTTAFMIGNVLGGLFISPISDRFGRRPVLLVCSLGFTTMFILLSFASNIWTFIVGRALHGLFYTGTGQSGWVLAFECTPVKMRAGGAFLFGMAWVAGYCGLVPIALVASSWRSMMLLCSIPGALFFLAVLIFVPESLHYLSSRGRFDEAQRWSKRSEDPLLQVSTSERHKRTEHTSLLQHLKANKKIIAYMAIISGIWITDAFLYFGLSMASTNLNDNMYLSYILIGLIEIPAYILTHTILKRVPRRRAMSSTHFASAAAFVFLIFTVGRESSWITLCGWVVGKLSISIAYMGIYVMGSEIFPTSVRNSAMGICGVLSRAGGVFAPYVVTLNRISPILPLTAFALVATFGGLTALLLPETKDRPLDETVEEQNEREAHEEILEEIE